jgi:glutamate-1-semialdehyde 2,1-aminomutase
MPRSSSDVARAPDAERFPSSPAHRERAHGLIPGGAHTYAKGDDQYPLHAPAAVVRGKGARVWDLDGNEFIEYGMGLRAVTLGHAHPHVVRAAARQMELGTNFVRPARIEVEYAEAFLETIEGADMVKFCKNGSDATTAAVKLARAVTGRDLVGICADHPFLSTDDWFIGTTPMDAGIPKAVRDLTVTFPYGDLDAARDLFDSYPGAVACLIMEAARDGAPPEGYLQGLKDLCEQRGALFVLDENITGFRWDLGGAQAAYGVEPHLSAFGKAMANGFAVSALCGKREFMELGGLRHDQPRVFLLSTTHGAETHGLAAALATLEVYRREPVIEVLHRQGERLRQGVDEVITRHGLEGHFAVEGRACNLVFVTGDRDGRPSQIYRTLFMQELIRRGILAPSFVVSFAHGDDEIDRTIDAVDGALEVYARGLDDGAETLVEGRSIQPTLRRYA